MIGDRKKLVMCQACRGLIDSSVKTCPLCGRDSVPPLMARATEFASTDHFFSRLILTINIALFAMMVLVDLRNEAESIMNSPSQHVFYDFGGRYVALIAKGNWWRLVTPNFLHLGIAHIMFNSMALYQIGPQVEEIFGSQKFIFLYLATGIFSNIVAFAFGIHGAGASGAIFGLIGLMAVYGHLMGGSLGRDLTRQMLIWAGIGIVLGFLIGADNVSHVSGFVAGAALGYVIKGQEPVTARDVRLWNVVAVLCAALVTASFVMVAINFGKFQSGRHVIVLDRGITRAANTLKDSINWKGSADGSPREIATRLRSNAADIERVAEVDQQSSQIREQLIRLMNKRADLLEQAEANPLPAIETARADEREMLEVLDAFDRWADGIMADYGLEYVPAN